MGWTDRRPEEAEEVEEAAVTIILLRSGVKIVVCPGYKCYKVLRAQTSCGATMALYEHLASDAHPTEKGHA